MKDLCEQSFLDSLPTTIKLARDSGSAFYYKSKPCKRGHNSPSYLSGQCCQCTRERTSKTKLEGTGRSSGNIEATKRAIESGQSTYIPEKACVNNHWLRYTGSNNCVQCTLDSRAKIKTQLKFTRIKKLYGINKEEYLILVKKQNSSCKICNRHFKDNFNLNVDHCHESGKVRGLLCNPCNQALGLFKDSPELLNKAVEYLLNASS